MDGGISTVPGPQSTGRPRVTGPGVQGIATLRSQLAPAAGPDLHLLTGGPYDGNRDASPSGVLSG